MRETVVCVCVGARAPRPVAVRVRASAGHTRQAGHTCPAVRELGGHRAQCTAWQSWQLRNGTVFSINYFRKKNDRASVGHLARVICCT